MKKVLLSDMQFLCEALFGSTDMVEFWSEEAKKAKQDGMLNTAKEYEEYASFAQYYNGCE